MYLVVEYKEVSHCTIYHHDKEMYVRNFRGGGGKWGQIGGNRG